MISKHCDRKFHFSVWEFWRGQSWCTANWWSIDSQSFWTSLSYQIKRIHRLLAISVTTVPDFQRAERQVLGLTGSNSSRWFALILLRGLESLSECRSESPLCCVYNEGNTHIYSLLSLSVLHTHNTLRLPSPINRTPGEQEGENQIQSGYWFEGVFENGGGVCLCSCMCVSSHSTPCQGPLLSKTTLQVLLFKGLSAASLLQLQSSFVFCAAAEQRLLHPRATSSRIPCELN